MESYGKYPIWLKGSRQTIWRCVYKDGAKFVVMFYGRLIEVVKDSVGYSTVLDY
jgi:hypothetical protein